MTNALNVVSLRGASSASLPLYVLSRGSNLFRVFSSQSGLAAWRIGFPLCINHVFFGQLIALPHSMPASDVVVKRWSAFQAHFRCARAGRLFSHSIHFPCMLYRGYRVRAARRRGTSKALAGDFPERPASRE